MKRIIYILSVLILLGGLIVTFNHNQSNICLKVGLNETNTAGVVELSGKNTYINADLHERNKIEVYESGTELMKQISKKTTAGTVETSNQTVELLYDKNNIEVYENDAVIMVQASDKNTKKYDYNENDGLKLNAKSYFLMDFNTGKTLAGSGETKHFEVASIVKLMTALLTMEKLEKNEWNLDTKLMTSLYAASMEGSQAFLDAGYQYTVDELLKSIIVASANDSSVVIAENMMGSEQNFVNLMNKRAAELGLSNTLYANSTGLPAVSQYSCARDTAILLKEVHRHDIYHRYSTIWMDKLIHESGRETELVNTNRLIKYYPGCDSGKTGFTDEAGYCLSASAERNGMRLISVVLGTKTSQERFETSSNLLNYGFSNYENKRIVNKDTPFEENIKIKGIREPISVKCEKDLFELIKRGESSQSEIKIEIDKTIKAPINKECVVGKVYLVENGVVVEECNLLSSDEHLKIGYWGAFKQALDNWRF